MEGITTVLNGIADAWWTWVVEAGWQAAAVGGVVLLVALSGRLSVVGLTPLALVGGLALPGVRPSEQEAPAKSASATSSQEITLRGKVVDPEGRPFAQARLLLTNAMDGRHRLLSWRSVGSSGDDGAFAVTFDVEQLQIPPRRRPTIVAIADGYGIAWFQPEKRASVDGIKLTLSRDTPATGRILDLQGEPVAGARVRPVRVMASTDGNLDTWLEAAKTNNATQWTHLRPRVSVIAGMGTCDIATTGVDGTFALHGVGAERVVHVFIEGDEIETTFATLVTRKMGALESKIPQGQRRTYHGIPAEIFVAPTRPIIGQVTDAVTGKPIAGITVKASGRRAAAEGAISAITDPNGRYRMTGLAVGSRGYLLTKPHLSRRYLQASARIPAREGADPITVDLELYRGVRVAGTVKDAHTKKSICGVSVFYTAMADNPNRRSNVMTTDGWTHTDKDGRFSMLALFGEGVVAIFTPKGYLSLDQQSEGKKLASLKTAVGMSLDNMGAFRTLNFDEDAESHEVAIEARPGAPLEVRVVDADDAPVRGVRFYGRTGQGSWEQRVR